MNLVEPTTADPQRSETPSDVIISSTATKPRSRRAPRILGWTVRLLFAMFLFVGALQLMRLGAASLDILQTGGFLVRNAGSTLGLGWLGALLVLSGSPIAATSLTLVAG